MRLNSQTLQTAPNEFSMVFIGDNEGLEKLAGAVLEATRTGLAKAVLCNDGVPTRIHVLVDCSDPKPGS